MAVIIDETLDEPGPFLLAPARSGGDARGLSDFAIMSAIAIYFLAAVMFFLTTMASAKEIGPDEGYCRQINDPKAGDEIVLRPGRYQNGCKLRRGGTPEARLTIRAADPANPPVIEYEGTESNVFEIYVGHIVIRGLQFSRTRSDIDAIRVISGDDITIEDCKFLGIGGIAIVATHHSIKGFTVRRNTITNSLSTAMYFGCHNGSDCVMSDLLVEDNEIRQVTAPDPSIGYGIQIKLNSTAVIRGNHVANTKGPGIMVYGSQDVSETSLIERNFVSGSRNSSGILLGGGPAIVRNNITIQNREGGIGLQDYGNRGLLRNIIVTHNTMHANERGGIFISGEKLINVEIINNAGVSAWPLSMFSAQSNLIHAAGNVDCAATKCFRDTEKRDFAPVPGSPLLTAGVQEKTAMPTEDFFGVPRKAQSAIGAIEYMSSSGKKR